MDPTQTRNITVITQTCKIFARISSNSPQRHQYVSEKLIEIWDDFGAICLKNHRL